MPNAGYRPQGPQREIDRINTVDSTKVPIQLVPVPDQGVYRLECEFIAEATNGHSACYTRRARIKNVNGTVTVMTLQSDWTSPDDKTWRVYVEPYSANVQISVQGAASTSVAWTVVSRLFVQL